MGLQELITKQERIGDNLIVLEAGNYAIGCERAFDKGRIDIKFTPFANMNTMPCTQRLPIGDNATYLSNGKYARLSNEAYDAFNRYIPMIPNPLQPIEDRIEEAYRKMIEPLEITPVHRREWRGLLSIAGVLGITAIWPLAVLGTLTYCMLKRPQEHGDGYLVMAAVMAPAMLPSMIKEMAKEMAHPSVKGYRIKNKSLLKQESGGCRPAIDFHSWDDKETPDFFGDCSGAFLRLIFSDCFELPGGFIPEGADYVKERFNNAGYFLEADKKLVEEARQCSKEIHEEYRKWHEFQKGVSREELAGILKEWRE